MKEDSGLERQSVLPASQHKGRDLERPQRMLGVVLWLALLLVLMWMRVGFR